MSGVERRRLFCGKLINILLFTKLFQIKNFKSVFFCGFKKKAVLFHLAAALCVIWSLCVLIERSAEEVRTGKLGWPFWTKLVVVTVGLTGGIVFM